MESTHVLTLFCFIYIAIAISNTNSVHHHYNSGFDLTAGPKLETHFSIKRPTDPPDNKIPDYISSSNRAKHSKFLADVMKLVLDEAIFFNDNRTQNPYIWKPVWDLIDLFDFKVGEDPTDHNTLYKMIQTLITYSPHPSHPFMLDKRVAGLDPHALLGDFVAATMSNLVVTYQVAPIWTLMEFAVVKKIGKLIGWNNPEGVPTSGAGVANCLAMAIALQNKLPDFKQQGFAGDGNVETPLVTIYVSEDASYAFRKAAVYMGLNTNVVHSVKVDPATRRMDINDLKKSIAHSKRAYRNIMVVATAGTPITGAIDPIDEIAAICKKHGIWLHIDAEKGAGALFRDRQSNWKIGDWSKADSITFGTWMFAMPYVTTFLVTKENGKIQNSFGLHAPYVFTGLDLYNGSYDTGDHTIQTSRRPEVAKIWFSWQLKGDSGIRNLINYLYINTFLFVQDLIQEPCFETVIANPELLDIPQVALYYIPRKLRQFKIHTDDYYKFEVSQASRYIKTNVVRYNLIQLSLGYVKGRAWCLVLSFTNSVLSKEDRQYIIKVLKRFGEAYDHGRSVDLSGVHMPKKSGSAHSWGTAPLIDAHGKLFKDVFQLFLKKGIFFLRDDYPSKFKKPEVLEKLFDFEIGNKALSHDQVIGIVEKIIAYSPHWGHPYWIYQLAAGLDPYTLAADYVAAALNTPMITYEDSPFFNLMQTEVMKAFRKRIFGSEEGDDVFTDGGSMANQMAIALARRWKKEKGTKKRGLLQYVLYISEDGHYSTRKGAILQGLGGANVVDIEANELGQMDVKLLEKRIIQDNHAANKVPFMVVITTGTTIYGGIDDVEAIVKVCHKYELWCHVDGMFGGLVAMSDTYRKRMKGIEKVDSFGVDLHKLFGSTMVMSALITRHVHAFNKTFGLGDPIDYYWSHDLYPKEQWDDGDRHWQIDKRNNLFKFWLLWKAKGRKGFEGHVDHIIENTGYLVSELHRRRGFQPMLNAFEVTNVCFLYIPPSMRGMNQKIKEFNTQISAVSFKIEIALIKAGIMNIVAQSRHSARGDTAIFLKFVMMGSALTKKDIDYLLNAVDYFGKDLDTVHSMHPSEARKFVEEMKREDKRFDPFGNQPRDWRLAG